MNNSFFNWVKRYISIPLVILIGVMVYILFIQENSVTRIYHNKKVIDSLQVAIQQNEDTMRYYRELNERLDNKDPEIIERIVRENHSMNLPDEDVYIID